MKYRNICTSDAFNEAYSLEEANMDLANRFYELTKDWDPSEVMQDFLEFVPDKVLQDYINWLEETSLDESYNLKTKVKINEALRVTKARDYNTKYGTFIIETREGKSRRTNYMTGKKEWQKVRSTNGYFADHPNAGRFYVYTEDPYSDNPDKYVTCSEGNGSYEWMEELGFSDFDEFFENVVPETVKCFQEYYGDDTIR